MPYARMIDRDDRIRELRPGAHRLAYVLREDVGILLHAWRKTSQALDLQELRIAKNHLVDWETRTGSDI